MKVKMIKASQYLVEAKIVDQINPMDLKLKLIKFFHLKMNNNF